MAEPIRILLVDDSTFVRRAVERMLEPIEGVEVVGHASHGEEAVEKVLQLRPDVVILDVNLPDVDGLEVLQRIMSEAPTSVLMLSTQTREGAQVTLRALELGAVDFVDKASAGTSMDIHRLAPVLREKVLAAAGASPRPRPQPLHPQPVDRRSPAGAVDAPGDVGAYEMVLIGASTGGPRALLEVLSALPADFPSTVLVAQHMPSGFTQTLAERLNRRCAMRVREASDGERLHPGDILIAPGGRQMSVARDQAGLLVRVEAGPPDLLHRPSINRLFRSAAELVGARAVGVVLTGMGDDGAQGLRTLREAGARTLAESEETAVIYGMPRAAAPAAERVLRLEEIGPALVALCDARSRPRGGA